MELLLVRMDGLALGPCWSWNSSGREASCSSKNYRPGFEGNDQFALSGEMVRSTGEATSLTRMIWVSLAARVAAEVSFDLQAHEAIAPLEGRPPVVAAYRAKGRRRHTVILPFVLAVSRTFRPASRDATVYDAQWREPMSLLGRHHANESINCRILPMVSPVRSGTSGCAAQCRGSTSTGYNMGEGGAASLTCSAVV